MKTTTYVFQVALAKQFLAEKSCEADQMAVHWLVKAADQGHHEGLELLKDCFDGNRGVTEHTYPRVRSLLDMSVQVQPRSRIFILKMTPQRVHFDFQSGD